MRRQVIFLLFFTMLVFTFCSCAGSPAAVNTSAATTTQTDAATTAAQTANEISQDDAQPVSLLYWILGAAGSDRERCYLETADAYMEKHPNVTITIEYEIGNQSERAQKLYTMLISGTGPDVFHCNGMHIHDYGNNDLIYPLENMPGVKEIKQFIYDNVLEDCSNDGIILGLPIRSNSVEMFWNKKHFADVGLDPEHPPETWDEVREYAIKLTQKDDAGNVTRYGLFPGFFSDLQQTAHYWSSLFFNLGGEYVTDGVVTFNTDDAIKCVEYWNDLINVLEVCPTNDITNGFETEMYSMRVSGEWDILTYEKYPEIDFGFARMPSWVKDNGMPVAGLGGQYMAIPSFITGANLDYAADFILFSASKEEQMRYVKNKIGTSGRKDILDDPFFSSSPSGRMYMTAIENLAYTKLEYAPNMVEMMNALGNAIHDVILNGADAKQALDKAASDYQKVYDKEMGRT